MAKYRSHSLSHDRLLGRPNQHVPSADGDFQEHDVWMMSDRNWPNRAEPNRLGRTKTWTQTGPSGGLSLQFEGPGSAKAPQCHHTDGPSSLPVDVPVWNKMARAESSDSMNCSGDESEWVPPHEYLARGSGKGVTTSVFEGAGRTLKGRDMSRVRDAVWSRTGFFG